MRYDNLIIYRKQLGDVLLLQPALELMAKQGMTAIATRPAFADLIALMPGPVCNFREWLPKARRLYCLEARRSALLYASLSLGAQRTLVLTRNEAPWWVSIYFDETRIVPGNNDYRAALFHAALGGKTKDFRAPRLNVPPDEWRLSELPKKYGVIHPTSAWQRKTWSPERWIEALHRANGTLPWVVSSGSTTWEIELANKIATGLGNRAINLAGKTTLRQYLALLANARLTLTVDSSASHISAAFGRPTLTLFGPTNPAHWHFPTPTSLRLWAADFTGETRPPVDAISVPVVSDAIKNLLELTHD